MLFGSLFQRACRVHPGERPVTFGEDAADGIAAGLDQPASAG